MWIKTDTFDEIVRSNAELLRRVEALEESRDSMNKKIDTISINAEGIPYGEEYIVYSQSLYGFDHPERKRKTLSEAVTAILNHLKLEFTVKPEVPESTKLTKIKPIKPIK